MDVVLEVGEVSEQVTVTGRAATLQTESAEVKAEISDAKLVNLRFPSDETGSSWCPRCPESALPETPTPFRATHRAPATFGAGDE